MPNSPHVDFRYTNLNEKQSTPLLGVSYILARTTKGPIADPSTLIRTLGQFRDIYGSEIVPDGSASNIETALALGSTLRVVRVGKPNQAPLSRIFAMGKKDPSTMKWGPEDPIPGNSNLLLSAAPPAGQKAESFRMDLTMKDSSSIVTDCLIRFKRTTEGTKNDTVVWSYELIPGNLESVTPLVTNVMFKAKGPSMTLSTIQNFMDNDPYMSVKFTDTATNTLLTKEQVVSRISSVATNATADVTWETTDYGDNKAANVLFSSSGTPAEVIPTADDWVSCLDSLADYSDAYQLGCSHINQHLTAVSDVLKVHKAAAVIANKNQDYIYYIDVPIKFKGVPSLDTDIIKWVTECIAAVGESRYVAYFAGGYKYYNSEGILKDSENLGTAIGLGDSAASQYGPWKSFAGMARGTVSSAGIVSPNYGAPSNYDKLNALAQAHVNMSVIKDTRNQGKRVMLWHNFTSQALENSYKFISTTRLVIYLKKFLKPLIESYFEEPNDFETWSRIYYEAKIILDDLVTNRAIFTYDWQGDQFAKSLSELSTNTESDVRAGKYKAILKFKDIVTLQEVTISFVMDATNGSVEVK